MRRFDEQLTVSERSPMIIPPHPESTPRHNFALTEYVDDMRLEKYSPVTISDRVELLQRLARHIAPVELIDATEDELRGFQHTFSHLSPNTVNVYSRHILAFYAWAYKRRRIARNTAEDLPVPRVPRGVPHPTSFDDLRIIFACTSGPLRMAYVLASFAGLRRGEICRLRTNDLDLNVEQPTALINGKGGHQRRVPILEPVLDELREHGPARGWIVTDNGRPYPVEKMSIDSHYYLRSLGLETTLHSMRGTFATNAGRLTKDALLIRDILGHRSVATTEIYMATSMDDAHARLAGFAAAASDLLRNKQPKRWRGLAAS